MSFKEFAKWCNIRASDGCWGRHEAFICISIIKYIYSKPFILRNYYFKKVESFLTKYIVIPTIRKIVEINGIDYLERFEKQLVWKTL